MISGTTDGYIIIHRYYNLFNFILLKYFVKLFDVILVIATFARLYI